MNRVRAFQFGVVAVVLGLSLVLGLVLATILSNSGSASRSTSELLERGEQDRACLVALALELGDPARDRTVPPELPEACEDSQAARQATE